MDIQLSRTRVVKKLAPNQPGAVKLTRKHGDALVCVRHRLDASTGLRITTVELVVERVPVQRRRDPWVGVRIAWGEEGLRARAKHEGAKWDPEKKLWRIPRSVAAALDMVARIVESE